MARRAIMTILNARTQSFHPGIGGWDRITESDIALALGGLVRGYYLYGRYTILRDDRVHEELLRCALLEATKDRFIRDLHGRLKQKAGALQMAISVALVEHRDSSICKTCNGAGDMTGPPRIVCASCDGAGTRPLSGRQRAKRLGRSHSSYQRHWRQLYEAVFMMFYEWESEVERHLKKRI